MFSAQMRSSQYFRKARRYVMMPFHGVVKPERLGGLEVDHIVVNGLTEQAPDVL
jgi:hypothetical protein